MYIFKTIRKQLFFCTCFVLLSINLLAQNATVPIQQTQASSYNWVTILLVILTIVLAFVIWGLGRVLVEVSKQVFDKQKKIGTTLLTLLFLFTSQIAFSQTAVAETTKTAPNYGGLSSTEFYMFLIVICTELLAIFFLVFSIKRLYAELLPQKEKVPSKFNAIWATLDKKFFTKAVSIEKEADVMLDHNYDGIKELDNALPPWWKYGFYITIVIAFIYLFNFHGFGSGKSPTEEYLAEMDVARVEKEIYEASNKDKIDEKNVPMADALGIAAGQKIYMAKCLACHGAKGEGIAGPNLTDDYWLHKGSLNDIYNTLKVGYADKGMQSWATEFSPKEMSLIASFVKTLKGTNPPNAKEPQGDLFTENEAIKTDSVINKSAVSKTDVSTKSK